MKLPSTSEKTVSLRFENSYTGEHFLVEANIYLDYNLNDPPGSNLVVSCDFSELTERLERIKLSTGLTHSAIALNMEERQSEE